MTSGKAYPVSDLTARINVALGKFYSKLHYLINPAIHMKARFHHLLQEILYEYSTPPSPDLDMTLVRHERNDPTYTSPFQI